MLRRTEGQNFPHNHYMGSHWNYTTGGDVLHVHRDIQALFDNKEFVKNIYI